MNNLVKAVILAGALATMPSCSMIMKDVYMLTTIAPILPADERDDEEIAETRKTQEELRMNYAREDSLYRARDREIRRNR